MGGTIVTPVVLATGRVSAPRRLDGAMTAIQGPPGRDAAVGGGSIRYAEAPGSPVVSIDQGTRTALTFVVDPTQTQDYLNPPFKGRVSFDGTRITPRAKGDSLLVVVNLLLRSSIAGGQIKFDLDVNSQLGPTGSDGEGYFTDPGTPERITGKLFITPLDQALANGIRIYVTSTVPVSFLNEAIVIACLSAYQGP